MDGKAHPLTPVRADQERTALELRRGGVDYAVIAQKMQLSGPGQAYKIVQRALKRGVQEVAEDVRALELSRLDTMHEGLWPRAQRGDTFSVDRVLKIQERRSQYLGLDKPAKHTFTDPSGEHEYGQLSDEQLEREIALAVARVRGEAGTPGPGAQVPLDAAREAGTTRPAG